MKQKDKFQEDERFGRWTLNGQKPLGQGGNGLVWGAQDESGLKAAIKFLKRHHEGSVREKRFRNEIEFLKTEQYCPGILPLLDSNTPEVLSNESRLWFVTPLATPLTNLNLSGTESLDRLIEYFIAVAGTLSKLHEEAKYHRDIKPENLFLLGDACVIGDFGLVDFPEKEAITKSTEFMGPLFYIAPEMMTAASNASPGPADVYSLAKTIWVLATGQRFPLQGEQRMDTVPLRLSTYCPHPRARILDSFLERCTLHEATKRPSMRQVLDELTSWLKRPEVVVPPVGLTDLAEQYGTIFDAERTCEESREEISKNLHSVLNLFDVTMRDIEKHLNTFSQKKVKFIHACGGVPRLLFRPTAQGIEVLERNGIEIELSVRERHPIFLHCFVQAEALKNNDIRLIAGYIVELRISNQLIHPLKTLIEEVKVPEGSAQLENAVSALRNFLNQNLRQAATAFAEGARVQIVPG